MTRLEARFEAFSGHRTAVLSWRPQDTARAQALWLPAFGDEMNQTRRMVRLASQALAGRGLACHVFDPLGTGDSSADFEAATIEAWLDDAGTMIERILQRAPGQPLVLLGCRLGVALAVETSRRLAEPAALLVGWAPVLQGRMQLGGLLRAAKLGRLQASETSEAVAAVDPKTDWAQGRAVQLAGYPVSPTLAAGLEALDASAAPAARAAQLIDVRMPVEGMTLAPAPPLVARAQAWTEAGVPSAVGVVPGPAFWNVADLVDVPELVDDTLAALVAGGLA